MKYSTTKQLDLPNPFPPPFITPVELIYIAYLYSLTNMPRANVKRDSNLLNDEDSTGAEAWGTPPVFQSNNWPLLKTCPPNNVRMCLYFS